MILVDSSVWIDFFNGTETSQTDWLYQGLGNEPFAVGDIILVEVLQGFRKERDFEIARNLMSAFPCFDLVGSELALKCAGNYRTLRRKGVTIRKTIDVIIGTFCIEQGFSLLHDDNDFVPLERFLGLDVVPL